MRIVLDLQACQASSNGRGIGRYSMALALAIARRARAHEVQLVLNANFPASVAQLRHSFADVLPPSQIRCVELPVPVMAAGPGNGWRMLAAERIRAHFLASLLPDIVHVASLFEGMQDDVVASLEPGEQGFDTAVTLYDLIPLIQKERYLADPAVARWYMRKLESLKRADVLLAISAHARSDALTQLSLASDQVVNISSAADAIFQPRQFTAEARTQLLQRVGLRGAFIMYTGGIDYRKNIEGLIAAYAMLPGALRSQYQLAIVCSIGDAHRVRLQRLARSHGLADGDLVLTGFVDDDTLVALYNCTALFVFPSLYEGFGLPALEAMACGAPVIGSQASSIPEVIGRADALFDPASPAAISACMASVLQDPGLRASLCAHSLVQARAFSWDTSADRALDAFEEVHRRRAATQLSRGDAASGRAGQDYGRLVASLGALGQQPATGATLPTAHDLLQAADSIGANLPRSGPCQLLLDISEPPPGAGAAMLDSLLARAPAGYRVEPVRLVDGGYRHAHSGGVIDARGGDVLVRIHAAPALVPVRWQVHGVASIAVTDAASLQAELARLTRWWNGKDHHGQQ